MLNIYKPVYMVMVCVWKRSPEPIIETIKLLSMLAFATTVALQTGCADIPKNCRLQKSRVPGGESILFGVALPDDFSDHCHYPTVVAVPSGFQERSDVVADLRGLWGPIASARRWIVFVPASSTKRYPFTPGDKGLFGQGPEELIPGFITSQVARRFGQEESNIVLIEFGGGGSSTLSIAAQSPQIFRSVNLIPGVGLDYSAFEDYVRPDFPPINIFLSEFDSIDYDGRLASHHISTDRYHLWRIPGRVISDGYLRISDEQTRLILDRLFSNPPSER